MPLTISYDLRTNDTNHRNYIRSMLERFGWERLGGSVFRYDTGDEEENWLNEVIPSLMIFRSYIVAKGIELRFFTLDSNSIARIDWSEDDALLGDTPDASADLELHDPTNRQSSEERCRRAVDVVIDLFK